MPAVLWLRKPGLEEGVSKGHEVMKVNIRIWSTEEEEEISLERGRNLKNFLINSDYAILRAIKNLSRKYGQFALQCGKWTVRDKNGYGNPVKKAILSKNEINVI